LALIIRKHNTVGNTKYFPHFLQANAKVICQINPRPLPFTAVQIRYSHTHYVIIWRHALWPTDNSFIKT